VQGQVRISMTGVQALRWRQASLRSDEAEVKKEFEEELRPQMPPGVQVKTNHFLGLTDSSTALMVMVDVSGSIGTATGKRVFLPAVFFEASAKPLFVASKRENMVDLHYPRTIQDHFNLELPANLAVESLPKEVNVPLAPYADYVAKFVTKDKTFAYGRLFRLGTSFYKAEEYPQLRDFYQKVNTEDQTQVVLKVEAVPATAPAATGSGR
jgi:hypothetical protein